MGAARTISHALGSTPAFIIVKRTDSTGDWWVYHASTGAGNYLRLNLTDAASASTAIWNNTSPTDSVFSLGVSNANISGATYVAYLFASDAGGFGDDGSESIIKCGSFTTDGSGNASVDCGFEPQFIITKASSAVSNWRMSDTMRGWTGGTISNQILYPDTSSVEQNSTVYHGTVTSTGFNPKMDASTTFIYIAIRRPMKTPESGTEVFGVNTANGTPRFTSGFVVDAVIQKNTAGGSSNVSARLTGQGFCDAEATSIESSSSAFKYDFMNGEGGTYTNSAFYGWMFKRATGFFDVVTYTGDGVAGRTVAHNLGVAPELMIIKARDSGTCNWFVYHKDLGNQTPIKLNTSDAAVAANSIYFNSTTPDASVFTLGTYSCVNYSAGLKYIAYLFATLAGVSKVGSYTGTGADLNVDCGFSAGARFVLIKRTDSTGDWYFWDSVRGIVAGNDPYLLLNSTAAEVTTTDYIDPLSSGFTVTSTAPAALNASGGTYIYLAIA